MLEEWKFPNLGTLYRAKQLLQKVQMPLQVTQAQPLPVAQPEKKARRILHCTNCHEVVASNGEHIADAGFHFCLECADPNCGYVEVSIPIGCRCYG